MSVKGNYEYPAWCQMETALDSYQQDRTEYLEREASELGPGGKEQLERFSNAADSNVRKLVVPTATTRPPRLRVASMCCTVSIDNLHHSECIR